MTDAEHNKYIAFTFIAHGAFQVLMLMFMMAIFSMVFWIDPSPGQPGPPPAFFGIFFGFMFIVQMVFTLPSFVAAYGLLKRKTWARTSSIIAAVIAAMSVPIGTGACVYAMWFFLGDRWKSVYPESSGSLNAVSPELQEADESTDWQFRNQSQRDAAYQYREPPDWR